MKHQLLFVICILSSIITAYGQTPQAIPYQAVARDNAGNPFINQNISVRFSIHDATAAGTVVYRETQSVTTNSLGLFTVNIGQGVPAIGTFGSIDWAVNTKFIQVEMDPAGGVSYTDMGTQQMLSVPYALFSGSSSNGWTKSGNAGTVDGTDFIGTTDNVSLNFRVNNQKAGRIGLSDASTFFGQLAGYNNTFLGLNNTAMGQYALFNNISGGLNTALGGGALYQTRQSNNTGVGFGALETNQTGSNNTAIGVSTGQMNTSGSGNVFIGYNAAYNETGSNKLYIANSNTNPPLIYGNFSSGRIGLGTILPNFKLDIAGGDINVDGSSGYRVNGTAPVTQYLRGDGTRFIPSALLASDISGTVAVANLPALAGDVTGSVGSNTVVKLRNRTVASTAPTNGQVLTYNTTTTQWEPQTSAVSGWGLTGNAATNASTNFIGTTDGVSLNFKVNNQKAGRIDFASPNNTLLGYQTGNVLTGTNNTAIGTLALSNVTGGSFNTSLGYSALRGSAVPANNTGQQNTAIGNNAMENNTSGDGNVAVGRNSLQNNSSGTFNTAIGMNSMQANLNGLFNTATGYNSLAANTSGQGNTANGYYALNLTTDGLYNTAMGFFALKSNISGHGNTAVGGSALFQNTSSNNTAIGYNTLAANTNGTGNTALGSDALSQNVTGFNNTSSGDQSLKVNVAGNSNTANGSSALLFNTGNENTAIGASSLTSNTSGNNNTALGSGTLLTNTSGNSNMALGYNADVGSSALTNASAIGPNAQVNISNAMVLGNNANVGIGTSSPHSKLNVNGSMAAAVSVKTSSYTLSAIDYCVIYSGSGTGQTFTLPAASTCPGRIYLIVNQSSQNLGCSLYRTAVAATTSTVALSTNVQLISDGTEWRKIN
jgi:trimeric autotransporter adhesin